MSRAQDQTFTLSVFQGPLDLLLHLIKSNELEISEISISQITSQYLEWLRLMETLDLEVAGDYLVMAATLLNIKLRTLLPDSEEEIEEEAVGELDNFMTARALMQRLIEYRRFKEAAHALGRQAEHQAQVFYREVALPKIVEAEQLPEVRGDLDLLLEAFGRVIRFVERREYHSVLQENYTIEDKVALVRRRLLLEAALDLTELFEACREKVEVVVTLLAMLELCRMKEVHIAQEGTFGAISVRRRESPSDDAEGSAAEAEALKAEEARIIAERTHVLDDGIIPEEEEEEVVESGQVTVESGEAGEEGEGESGQVTVESGEAGEGDAGGARIIDIGDDRPEGR